MESKPERRNEDAREDAAARAGSTPSGPARPIEEPGPGQDTAEPAGRRVRARASDEPAPTPDPVRRRSLGRTLLNAAIAVVIVLAAAWLLLR